MKLSELLAEMRRLGVKLWLDGDRLRFDAPAGLLTDDLRGQLRARKAEIVDFLATAQNSTGLETAPIRPIARDGEIPLSFAQQRFWFLWQFAPDSPFYNFPASLHLSGDLDLSTLQWSLDQLVARHEILRTTFPATGGKPHQAIGPPAPVEIAETDLRGLPEADRGPEARRLAASEAELAFDLSRGPMLRARLLRLDDREHILVLTLHHITSDGWSMGVLIREMAELYTSHLSGRKPELPELPVQYADFAAWQRDRLQGDLLEKQLAYWHRQLAGLTLLELPTDRVRPPMQTHQGATETLDLSTELSSRLRNLASRRGATLFMTMLAAFNTLLHRYTRQDDIVLGSLTAGRNRAEFEGLIGPFFNLLAFRTDISGDPTFLDLLDRVRDMAVGAYANQDVPFELLVDRLGPRRDPSRNPFFQTVFSLQNMPMPSARLGPVHLTPSWAETPVTRFDFEAHVWENSEDLTVSFTYSTDLFEASTASRMLAHYNALLESIVDNPDRKVSELPLFAETEERQVLHDWNQTVADYPRNATIHEVFGRRVEETPEAVALVFDRRELTYAELNRKANQLARRLRTEGVGPDVLVGVCAERSVELVVAVLAILKAGGAYVPLDPDYPAGRLEFMIEDSAVPVLLTQQSLVGRLPAHSARLICLDTDWPGIAVESTDDLEVNVTAENLAHVFYTSGSTGRPKGTSIEHRAVLRLVQNTNYVDFGPDEVFLQFTTISFDPSTFEIWGALLNGSRLVVFPPGIPSLEELGSFLFEHGVTTLVLTTALFHRMVDHHLEGLGGIRQMIVGGDVISPSHVKKYLAALDGDGRRRLINAYGPTENTTISCCHIMTSDDEVGRTVPIGRPISNSYLRVLDDRMQPVPVGIPGELYVGGDGLAREYLKRPRLTAEKFVPDPFGDAPGARLYATGDQVRWLSDGTVEFLGRVDQQVKIRGFRVELGEIESVLNDHPAVAESVVLLLKDDHQNQRLVAYVVPDGAQSVKQEDLRDWLAAKLPAYMVPSATVVIESIPLSPNGKVDRSALPAPDRELDNEYVPPRNELEKEIAEIWQETLKVDRIGIHDNFFEVGGNSLLVMQLHSTLQDRLRCELEVADLFRFPTVDSLAAHLAGEIEQKTSVRSARASVERCGNVAGRNASIAIVGMAGRFPGAKDLGTFWSNLREGVESIRFFTDRELADAGVEKALLDNPMYVKAKGLLDGVDLFDAAFFQYSPKEAERINPQQRLLLQCAWEALEHAGYVPQQFPGLIGVYAGSSTNSYARRLQTPGAASDGVSEYLTVVANGKDFLASRISYKLNLRGPAVTVQTACSTSLVAVHEACRSLLDFQCDMALAGGASVTLPVACGYLYEEGAIHSPDGHCRAFDAQAQGTVAGNGVGMVVLKRLDDALADGDTIHAVILGSAVNNDGSLKVSYTAPGVQGQAEVIAMAQAVAGVDPRSVTYIETHGTGTELGDTVEVAALAQVFAAGAYEPSQCALGSLKTNVGHLDAVAGVAGLIKTALSIEHGELVPTVHFSRPNPELHLERTPFYVNDRLRKWPRRQGQPLRAGTSSFGIGGTNAHAILEEAPEANPSDASLDEQLLLLSARTENALAKSAGNLAEHLRAEPDVNLADAAYTLSLGRRAFENRLAVVCRTHDEATEALADRSSNRVMTARAPSERRSVAFMFSGQGAQHVDMAKGLYRSRPLFRDTVDGCSELLSSQLGLDLRDVLFPQDDNAERASKRLKATEIAQPALFVIEYALARLWMSWGVQPAAMVGHSIGQYTAACLAGVFSLEDALALVTARGRLMQQMPAGAMLAVRMSASQAEEIAAGARLALAAVNGPSLCVLSGEGVAVDKVATSLEAKGVDCRRLETSHAFHSEMMDPVLEPFRRELAAVALKPPDIPCVSNVSGTWLTAAEACDPDYWVRHLRQTVRFADGIDTLLEGTSPVLLEVGPGNTLATLAKSCLRDRQVPDAPANASPVVVSSMRHPTDRQQSDLKKLLDATGRLWLSGVDVDWAAFYAGRNRRRIPLPTYPFECERYWVDASPEPTRPSVRYAGKNADTSKWFYTPVWNQSARTGFDVGKLDVEQTWLIFVDRTGLGSKVADRLRQLGQNVFTVSAAGSFCRTKGGQFEIDPAQSSDYSRLIEELRSRNAIPDRIVHLWQVSPGADSPSDAPGFDESLALGAYGGLYLARALGETELSAPVEITFVSTAMQDVTGGDVLCPAKATVLGPCKVIPQEYPHITCRSVDVSPVEQDPIRAAHQVDHLLEDILWESTDRVLTSRGGRRWVQKFDPLPLEQTDLARSRLQEGGVYLVTGGLGNIGLLTAEHLLTKARARLILTSRRELPPRAEWDSLLESEGDRNDTNRVIRKLTQLDRLGGELTVVQADVADRARMQAVVDEAIERYGAINGVFHTAGVVDPKSFGPIRDTGREECLVHFRPKVEGTMVLAEVFRDRPLDFCMLFSSLSTVLGGIDFAAYSAANQFMNAFAQRQNQLGATPWIVVAWDGWDFGRPADSDTGGKTSIAELALRPEEGIEALDRILARGCPTEVVVSTGDLGSRLRQWIEPATMRAVDSASVPEAAHRYARPQMQQQYVAPCNELETALAEIWQESLGIDSIGIDDSFFEIGGDSLAGLRVLARIRESLGTQVAIRVLFENPTIARFAQYLENHKPPGPRTPGDKGSASDDNIQRGRL